MPDFRPTWAAWPFHHARIQSRALMRDVDQSAMVHLFSSTLFLLSLAFSVWSSRLQRAQACLKHQASIKAINKPLRTALGILIIALSLSRSELHHLHASYCAGQTASRAIGSTKSILMWGVRGWTIVYAGTCQADICVKNRAVAFAAELRYLFNWDVEHFQTNAESQSREDLVAKCAHTCSAFAFAPISISHDWIWFKGLLETTDIIGGKALH